VTRRRWAIGGGLAAFVLAVLLMRVFWDGHAALARGDAAMAKQDAETAITEWRRAARWYAPGAPHVRAAYDRLEALAASADPPTALEAWRAIRSSILSTRSFYTPFPSLLERSNQKIAELMGGGDEERRAFHLKLLEKDEAPSVLWSIVAILGFATWIGGGFWFAFRGVGEDDKLVRREAARAGALVAVGLIVWMLGLYLA
jgi:hypothetical protein